MRSKIFDKNFQFESGGVLVTPSIRAVHIKGIGTLIGKFIVWASDDRYYSSGAEYLHPYEKEIEGETVLFLPTIEKSRKNLYVMVKEEADEIEGIIQDGQHRTGNNYAS
jgi:hypothetical protein